MNIIEQGNHSKQSEINSSGDRIIGFDFARAIAILSMIIVNFKVVMEVDRTGTGHLVSLFKLLEGRAAATFVILAGVGLSLFSHHARLANDTKKIIQNRNTLFKRAIFLFITGLLFNEVWPADILHFYGVYIAIGALLLTASDMRLWQIAVIFLMIFVVLWIILDYDIGWNWETIEYHGVWTPAGMLRHLFFNGFHPVFPWTSFLLIGMWLGRRNLSDHGFRKKLLGYSLAVVIVSKGISTLFIYLFPDFGAVETPIYMGYLLGTDPMPPGPFYLLSAGGTALIVITLCIMLTERFTTALWVKPFVATGQISLTLYVAHVIVGMGTLEEMGLLYNQSSSFAIMAAGIFYAVSMGFALIWKRFFKLGPLEWGMRRLT
jgi:uncharacterized membrane protein YeiB